MENETLIFQAAADGNLAKVETLLKRNPTLINLRDRHSKTPLHEAATVDVAGLLIRYGADVNARGWMGSTPLHEMTSKDRLDLAQLLIAHGADVNATREYDLTPLHWAKSVQLARLLLQHGAAVSPRDVWGQTPFQNAVSSGELDFVNLFIEYGAEIQIVDNLHGRTPLHIVPNAQVLKRLLELGLPVNVASRTGDTPLHNAVTRGNKEMVRLLLDYGADVTIRNQHGVNPVHLARQKAPEILNFLEQHMQIHNVDLYGVPEHLSSKQLIVNAKRSEAMTVVDHAILVRWELADPPKPLHVLYTEHTHLRILASSSDGNYILMWAEGDQGNSEGILELRAWETLELVKRIPQPMEGPVQSAAFSPNGQWLALAIDSQEAVYLIDKDTGENLAEVSGGEWTASVRFAPTSELLAVACSFQGGATVGIHKHEQIWIENVFEFGRSDYTTSANQFVDTLVDVAFSPDSRFLILFETSRIYHELYPAGWRGNLALYSVENGNLQWQTSIDAAATGDVRSLAEAGYSSGFLTNVVFLNADVIACGSTAGCVLLYNTALGKLIQLIRVHPDASVISLALDSAGAAIWVLLSNGDLVSVSYSSVVS